LNEYQEFLREHIGRGLSMTEAARLWRESRLGADRIPTDPLADAVETTFGLERDLQSALRSNIEQLEGGLKITDGGKELEIDAGRIDITAEVAQGATVVLELKAGTASPDSVAQILGYMGSLQEKRQGPVRGILVAGDFHPRVIFAARAVPNLKLMKYSFKFTFDPVQ
jgi:RecB family endonuclease NucS